MFTEKEIMEMSPEEFSKNWKNRSIQDSALKLIGARDLTPEDLKHIIDKK